MTLRTHTLLVALVLPLGACTPEVGEDPAEHACEHIAETHATLTAVATMGDITEAEEIEPDSEPYLVELTESEAGFIGIHAHEDTEAILWVDTADVVAAIHHDGTEETLPTPAPSEACPDDIPEHFELDLHEGAWSLELGPSAVTEVWLMLTPAAGHGHEHEEQERR